MPWRLLGLPSIRRPRPRLSLTGAVEQRCVIVHRTCNDRRLRTAAPIDGCPVHGAGELAARCLLQAGTNVGAWQHFDCARSRFGRAPRSMTKRHALAAAHEFYERAPLFLWIGACSQALPTVWEMGQDRARASGSPVSGSAGGGVPPCRNAAPGGSCGMGSVSQPRHGACVELRLAAAGNPRTTARLGVLRPGRAAGNPFRRSAELIQAARTASCAARVTVSTTWRHGDETKRAAACAPSVSDYLADARVEMGAKNERY